MVTGYDLGASIDSAPDGDEAGRDREGEAESHSSHHFRETNFSDGSGTVIHDRVNAYEQVDRRLD
jgi:hypothetical protein